MASDYNHSDFSQLLPGGLAQVPSVLVDLDTLDHKKTDNDER